MHYTDIILISQEEEEEEELSRHGFIHTIGLCEFIFNNFEFRLAYIPIKLFHMILHY